MSTVRRFAPLIFTLGLAACATARPPAFNAPATMAAAPAPVAGYDWFYHDDPDELRLVYGMESSDDVRFGLACRPGKASLILTADAHAGAREIALESGGDTERFPASSEPSPLSGGDFLTAESATTVPVFQRFRRLGWLAIWDGRDRTMMAAHPQSATAIERFFARCG